MKKLKSEIKRLQNDYKQCMEAIKVETTARNKAETLASVMKETIETQL